jgi:type I restriction enzyme R subunit
VYFFAIPYLLHSKHCSEETGTKTGQDQSALVALSQDEGLKREALDKVLANYLFTEKTPMRDDVIGIMETRPALRERRSVADRVIEKIKAFVQTFIEGVD